MASIWGFITRSYTAFNPPTVPKRSEALRFGILGAANIAPMALIQPAKSHPEVIVAAVAARDYDRAKKYAKQHDIPIVHKTYDDLINDPSLDCIYNPLPNGLHYEWTIKALKAGKHVLLEKPSVSNSTEAESLFRHPLLSQPNAPVLLEAFHYQFHPAWVFFRSLFDSKDVENVEVKNRFPAGWFKFDDIRFIYSLSGGTLMDFGSYAVSSMRNVFGTEPSAVASATYREMPPDFDEKCDMAIYAVYEFAGGGTASIEADLQARGGYGFSALTKNWPSIPEMTIVVRTKPREERDGDGSIRAVSKDIKFSGYIHPHLWHSINITTTTVWKETQNSSKIPREEKKTETKKVYKWADMGSEHGGEDWWTTYRHQLNGFVDRVKKRAGTGIWIDGEESIKQIKVIDRTYEKAGLPLRPTSKFLSSSASL